MYGGIVAISINIIVGISTNLKFFFSFISNITADIPIIRAITPMYLLSVILNSDILSVIAYVCSINNGINKYLSLSAILLNIFFSSYDSTISTVGIANIKSTVIGANTDVSGSFSVIISFIIYKYIIAVAIVTNGSNT